MNILNPRRIKTQIKRAYKNIRLDARVRFKERSFYATNSGVLVVLRHGIGNKLLQYCFARMLSLRTGLRMDTKFERSHHEHSIEEPELEFLKGFGIQTKVQGLSVNGVPCILDSRWLMRSNDDDLEDILRAIPTDRPLLVYSQFFRYGWLRAYKKEIKTEWLNIDQTELPFIQASSACVHMRFGDLTRANMNLGEQYYHKAIQLLDSDEISIVTDDPGHPIVKSVARKYGAKIIKHQRWIEDFYFMLAHKRIATAESTFSWWAAWLSEAERIIAPGSNIDRAIYGGNRYWANMKSTPFVDDEPRYIYI